MHNELCLIDTKCDADEFNMSGDVCSLSNL